MAAKNRQGDSVISIRDDTEKVLAYGGGAVICTSLLLATGKITSILPYDPGDTSIALMMVAGIVIGFLSVVVGDRVAKADWINRKLDRLPVSVRADARSLIETRLSQATPVTRQFVLNAIEQAREADRASIQRALLR